MKKELVRLKKKTYQKFPFYFPFIVEFDIDIMDEDDPRKESAYGYAIPEELKIRLNPSIFDKSIEFQMEVFIHEMEHIIREHGLYQRRKRYQNDIDKLLAQIACEIEILNTLERLNIPIEKGYWYEFHSDLRNRNNIKQNESLETIIEKLKNDKEISEICKNIKNLEDMIKEFMDIVEGKGYGEKDIEEISEIIDKLKQEAIEIIKNSEQKGNIPGWLEIEIEKRNPKKDWKKIIKRRMMTIVKGKFDYSYRRPNYKREYSKFIFPSTVGIEYDKVYIVFDTSGSMGDKEILSQIKSEIRSIAKINKNIEIWEFDTELKRKLSAKEIMKDNRICGLGGTDMKLAIEKIYEETKNRSIVIVFTDCYTDWPDKWVLKKLEVYIQPVISEEDSLPSVPYYFKKLEPIVI